MLHLDRLYSALVDIARQPLLHFLLLGALLFAVDRALISETSSSADIVIGREQLLTMLQFRAKAFDRERFEAELDSLSKEAVRALEREWLREELLYREAKALRLDRDDYVIRQRLASKMEFIARGFIDDGDKLPRKRVEAYFDAHRSDYARPASVTFTHVYFSKAIHGSELAARLAGEALKTLTESSVPFEGAVAYGDQFAYHSNYVERSRGFIEAQFGESFARELFVDGGQDGQWRGPLESVFGFHLVLVAGRQPERAAALEDVYVQVELDAREAGVKSEMDRLIAEMESRYRITAGDSRS